MPKLVIKTFEFDGYWYAYIYKGEDGRCPTLNFFSSLRCNMKKLLEDYIKWNKRYVQGDDDPVGAMMCWIASTGGDTTCQLMEHFGKDLRKMVTEEMRRQNLLKPEV